MLADANGAMPNMQMLIAEQLAEVIYSYVVTAKKQTHNNGRTLKREKASRSTD